MRDLVNCCKLLGHKKTLCLHQYLIDTWFVGFNDGIGEVFVVWESRQIGKVRCAVVAKYQSIALVLKVKPIVKEVQTAVVRNYCFTYLKQMACNKTNADSQINTFRCKDFFKILLDIRIRTLQHRLLGPNQIIRNSITQHLSDYFPQYA